MYAELVCAACHWIELHVDGSVRILAYDFVVGDCLLALIFVNFLSWTLIVIRTQWKLDSAFASVLMEVV
jgi:hypothetical protein